MTSTPEGITNPPIDDLLDVTESKYELVVEGSRRARQINAYYAQLQEGLLENVGPLVTPEPNEKPLSIAFREIHEGKIIMREPTEADFAPVEEPVFADDYGFADALGGETLDAFPAAEDTDTAAGDSM
ncbi:MULTISPECIES: DNA-directed RNA polymerase subunit omega [Brevibacterium]|uniref:DNA-directed RNA polymerase subunit omega n=1 Tax=Brevibacterium salitolerans TaxID=1403566 RepID=A0ABP5I034_9MICO|nr:DNA-directed RNA polymerase subunit omega [Brevibacterium sp.]